MNVQKLSTQPKTAVLLLNMGGPEKLDDVQPFLYNLFSDPDIIRLPFSSIFQKPLAYRISTNRLNEAKHNYSQMGGGSPILKFTQAQADAMKAELSSRGYDLPIYIAMRYWNPFTSETLKKIQNDGVEKLIVIPLYPHFSYTTTGSSLNELKRVMLEQNLNFELSIITSYWDHPIYQKSVAETIEQSIQDLRWSCTPEKIQILFTAHSLPQKHIKRTNDPYPTQIYQCAKQIMKTYFPNNEWDLCYQSQVGKMLWLGPQTDGVLHYYAAKNINNVLMVPISFVSDHIETLVEIDKLYQPLAEELGILHCHRASALNTHPTFIQALTVLAMAELESTEPSTSSSVDTVERLVQAQAVQ